MPGYSPILAIVTGVLEVAVCARPDALVLSRLACLDILWLPPAGPI